MIQKKLFSFPFLLFLFSFIIRLLFISKGPYNVDCLNIALLGEKTLDNLYLENLVGTGYPLTLILAAIFIFIGRLFSINDPVIMVNFMSVVFGALCVPVLYIFVKKLFNHTVAFFSALLLSICPIIFGLSTYGMNHMPALFFFLFGLLSLLNYLETNQNKYLFLSAIFLGFLGSTRLQDLVLTIIPVSFFFLFFRADRQVTLTGKQKCLHYLYFLSLIGITVLIFHLPYIVDENRLVYFEQLKSYNKASLAINDPIINQIAITYNLMYLFQTLSPLGFILSLLGLFLLIKPYWRLFIFLILWIIIPSLLFINIYTAAPRFQTIIIPPFLIAQGYLISRFYTARAFSKWAIIFIFLLNVYLTIGHYLPYFAYRNKNSVIIDYMKWLTSVTEKDARIISSDIGRLLPYYAHRTSMGRLLHFKYIASYRELVEYKEEVYTLLKEGVPIYITEMGLYTYDFGERFSTFMKDNFELEYVGESLYEDWHRGCLHFNVFPVALYKLGIKE